MVREETSLRMMLASYQAVHSFPACEVPYFLTIALLAGQTVRGSFVPLPSLLREGEPFRLWNYSTPIRVRCQEAVT